MGKLFVANRGEVAVRVIRAAHDLGWEAVCATVDGDDGPWLGAADGVARLPGSGPAGYLDVDAVVAAAVDAGCRLLHPGWGFLSESAALARRCADAGVTFVGPAPETLELFGDKVAARREAAAAGLAVPAGTDGPATPGEVRALLESLGPGRAVMLKAVAGGGGRGMRPVRSVDELDAAWERCAAEAAAAFGDDRLYAEELIEGARHIEVQIVGDPGGVVALGERDCSIQRRRQKVVEVAPAPGLGTALREAVTGGAVALGERVGYRSVGTVELLVAGERALFIEANPRLQVEHPVTEEVFGVDLVVVQLLLADGATLTDLGLVGVRPSGFAMELRINAERMTAGGTTVPSTEPVRAVRWPTGPGIRVDTAVEPGWAPNPEFDTLIAKLVVAGPDRDVVLRRARRAVAETLIEGPSTNLDLLAGVLDRPEMASWDVDTTWLERTGLTSGAPAAPAASEGLGNLDTVTAPLRGTVVTVDVEPGDEVPAGAPLVILEAMKMQHEVTAPRAGIVQQVLCAPGRVVDEGAPLVVVAATGADTGVPEAEDIDPDRIRDDLAEVLERHRLTTDEARPEAVERRRRTGQRTARENIADLVDDGSFIEYGPLVLAAQRRRRSLDELIARTPADGLVGGLATVNRDLFGPRASRVVVASYDYTVLAGTQGLQNHRKKDRLFELAERERLPVVLFAEGGGGRPGDTDGAGVAGLDCLAFWLFGRLSGLVPLVGVVSGRCFAGNAALAGSCDVIIATEDANIGMGGPAMIEGGGLGVYDPSEVGPVSDLVPAGVVDVLVSDEAEAVAVARRYLSYFQGTVGDWTCADQRILRHLVPENRLRVYDVRRVIEHLADTGSVLELRRGFGHGMITALARIEGRPLGIVANNPMHLAGAIDRDAADKAARFLQLCDAHDLPVLFLCDTPGIMVGPASEREGNVRHAARLFVIGANLDVPFGTVILRKGYGLGAQAMAGGSFKAPLFCVSWPTGEFGGMGLEGAVKLGYRRELEAIEDPSERQRTFEEMVARMYEVGKAINMASHFEIDDVIDPAETRAWVSAAFAGARAPRSRPGKRPWVDTW